MATTAPTWLQALPLELQEAIILRCNVDQWNDLRSFMSDAVSGLVSRLKSHSSKFDWKALDTYKNANELELTVDNIKRANIILSSVPDQIKTIIIRPTSDTKEINLNSWDEAAEKLANAAKKRSTELQCHWLAPINPGGARRLLDNLTLCSLHTTLPSPAPLLISLGSTSSLSSITDLMLTSSSLYVDETTERSHFWTLSHTTQLTRLELHNVCFPNTLPYCSKLQELVVTGNTVLPVTGNVGDVHDVLLGAHHLTDLQELRKLQDNTNFYMGSTLVDFAHLQKLQELHVNGLQTPSDTDTVLQAVTSLKTLYNGNGLLCGSKDEEPPLGQFTTILPNLQCLETYLANCDWYPNVFGRFSNAVRGHSNLQHLTLRGLPASALWQLGLLPSLPKLKHLNLSLNDNIAVDQLDDVSHCTGITHLTLHSLNSTAQSVQNIVDRLVTGNTSSTVEFLELTGIRATSLGSYSQLLSGMPALKQLRAAVAIPGINSSSIETLLQVQGISVMATSKVEKTSQVQRPDDVYMDYFDIAMFWSGSVAVGAQSARIQLELYSVPERKELLLVKKGMTGLLFAFIIWLLAGLVMVCGMCRLGSACIVP